MEKWLSIAVGVYLAGMILYGHCKGFIKLSVSAAALVATLLIVRGVTPQAADFIKTNTRICVSFEESILSALDLGETADQAGPSGQRMIIEALELPKQLKDALLENNNNEVYHVLGVEAFSRYIAKYLANSILNMILFLILFVIVFTVIKIVTVWLDLVARLPVLNGINKIAGGILGGVEGVLYLWVAFLFITAFSATSMGRLLIRQIESSAWLFFLYERNLLGGFAMAVMKHIL